MMRHEAQRLQRRPSPPRAQGSPPSRQDTVTSRTRSGLGACGAHAQVLVAVPSRRTPARASQAAGTAHRGQAAGGQWAPRSGQDLLPLWPLLGGDLCRCRLLREALLPCAGPCSCLPALASVWPRSSPFLSRPWTVETPRKCATCLVGGGWTGACWRKDAHAGTTRAGQRAPHPESSAPQAVLPGPRGGGYASAR